MRGGHEQSAGMKVRKIKLDVWRSETQLATANI